MANEVYNLYRKYLNEPMSYRLSLGKIAYRKAKEKLQTCMSSWDAFNGAICLSLMCLCGDGNFTYNDYEIFKEISGCSPTYQEACGTVRELSYNLIINKIRGCNQDTVGQCLYLCSVIFAIKGSYGNDEDAIVRGLSR